MHDVIACVSASICIYRGGGGVVITLGVNKAAQVLLMWKDVFDLFKRVDVVLSICFLNASRKYRYN